MNDTEKIIQMRDIIKSTLTPLIDHDYWLLEVPYYPNVGDGLIWQGELDFLYTLPYHRKGMSSYNTEVPNNIATDDIILLQGGGNFGDIWPLPHEYRINVIKKYPNNKIIILPQSVWFENPDNLKDCAALFARFKNVTICARDNYSYEVLTKHFINRILLLPDMAFCINMDKLPKYPITKGTLLLKRQDKELKQTTELSHVESSKDLEIADWYAFHDNSWQTKWFRRVRRYLPMFPDLYDWYAHHIFRPYLIDNGIRQISAYEKIHSTRLHAAILSILIGKSKGLVWYDNSYGKNKNFYDTWLKDCDGIKFIDNK